MARGRGRGSIGRVIKTSTRGRGSAGRGNMPSVPVPTISSQQGGTNSSGGQDQVQTCPTTTPPIQTSGHGSTPSISESSPIIPNESNVIGEGASTQRNAIAEGSSAQSDAVGEGESNSNVQRTLIFLSPSGLEPSRLCSETITEIFKNEIEPNGVNWKSVSQETKDFYLGEFEKAFYWDSSIDSEVRKQWRRKAARRYCDFVSSIKGEGIRPVYVPKETWESWKKYWADPKVIEKSKIASKNRRGGEDAAASGTHTGGSISIGEHHKRLAIKKGRDPTPSEVHLHVHTHGHDGKSFVGERARIVHEKYQEILQNQSQTQSEVDQCQAYYEDVGGVKKRRIYGLGSQAHLYYGPNLRPSSVSDATSSVPPPNAQPEATGTLDELVTRLIPALTDSIIPALTDSIIPALTDRLLPIIVERVRGLNPSVSSQMDTPNDHPSSMAPIVSAPATANIDQVHASVSDDDRGSPVSH
ncbi:uncharacterized protein LOC132640267 isoform X2 [Lycium barbarum]|uniref:uncharacterized protein LOC132640267 isoform X2 n=1 Tax=Lycium barbarum TaxID=112863 RepID=UPI00293F56F4|nr:uncharacterized protein LOC132640267 isoform X2 [Lycium barbarum]